MSIGQDIARLVWETNDIVRAVRAGERLTKSDCNNLSEVISNLIRIILEDVNNVERANVRAADNRSQNPSMGSTGNGSECS